MKCLLSRGVASQKSNVSQRPLLVFATDGSGQGGQAGWGLTSVRTTHEGMQADTDAGFDPEAAVREECGRVITNPNQAEHLGATRATNNTGELSAVHCGLPRADGRARAGAAGRGSAHPLRLADIAICTTSTCRTTARLAHPGRRAMLAASDPLSRSFTSSVVGAASLAPGPRGEEPNGVLDLQ